MLPIVALNGINCADIKPMLSGKLIFMVKIKILVLWKNSWRRLFVISYYLKLKMSFKPVDILIELTKHSTLKNHVKIRPVELSSFNSSDFN